MRKILAILLAVMLIAAMSVTAFAVTPREYKPVKLPKIKVDTGFLQGVISRWLIENPIELPDIDIKVTSKTLG